MSGLTQLRDGLVERSTSLLDEASHLAERGAHSAARIAEDQASALRSALPNSLPVSLPRAVRRRRSPSLASRSTRLGLIVALVAVGAAVYMWRSKQRSLATTDHLDVDEASHRAPSFAVAS